jgi:hypothetical protein
MPIEAAAAAPDPVREDVTRTLRSIGSAVGRGDFCAGFLETTVEAAGRLLADAEYSDEAAGEVIRRGLGGSVVHLTDSTLATLNTNMRRES